MRSGQEVTVEQSFSGRLRRYIVSTDPDVNARNLALIADHWRKWIRRATGGPPKGRHLRDVPVEVIDDFLTGSNAIPPLPDEIGRGEYLERLRQKRPLG